MSTLSQFNVKFNISRGFKNYQGTITHDNKPNVILSLVKFANLFLKVIQMWSEAHLLTKY